MGIFNEFNKKEKPVFTGSRFGFGSGGGGGAGGSGPGLSLSGPTGPTGPFSIHCIGVAVE